MEADHAEFLKWVETEQQAKEACRTASRRMLAHPLLEVFSQAVGVDPKAWGQPTGNLGTEVSLFEEWLQAAEEKLVKDTRRGGQMAGVRQQGGPDTMETQVEAPHEVHYRHYHVAAWVGACIIMSIVCPCTLCYLRNRPMKRPSWPPACPSQSILPSAPQMFLLLLLARARFRTSLLHLRQTMHEM